MAAGAPAYAGEGPPALWHVSEEPGIERFEPRPAGSRAVAAGAAAAGEALVWAVDTRHLPAYWFPRDCPRATFWRAPATAAADAARLLPGGASRVHAIEWRWLERVRACRLFAYRLPEAGFELRDANAGYWTTASPVEPAEVVVLDDLLGLHRAAGIELRLVPALGPLWREVVASSLGFSGIRLGNASPPVGA